MASAAFPLFVNVTLCAALVVDTCKLVNVKLVGLSVTAGAGGAVPVPLNPTLCGLPLALSVTFKLAVRIPVAVGVKLTLMVQLAPAAIVLGLSGQVFAWPKSLALVPLIPIPLIVSGAVPLFVRVTVCVPLAVFTT